MSTSSLIELQLPDHISVRLVRLDDEDLPPWQDLLTPEECARMRGFGSEKRRRMFVQGRVAARLLLSERLQVPPHSVPLAGDNNGGPTVGIPDLHISIAHAGPYGFAAASTSPVGVDIEEIVPRNPDLYRFLLDPDEFSLLDHFAQDHDRAQILIWALKEAVLKGRRSGFRFSPRKVRLSLDLSRGTAEARDGQRRWSLCFKEHRGFYLAVAY